MLAFVALATMACSPQRSSTDPAASTNETAEVRTIIIENMRFDPAELTVERGTRIVWKNQDLFPHTATAESFDSGNLEVNDSWSYVANEPGVHAYRCTYHPTMEGRLIVQ